MSDYFIGEPEGPGRTVQRAMVSLGPLSDRRYCTYSCPFCYVTGSFQKYQKNTPTGVYEWLAARRDKFNVVYVSGDTDSFSPPRTAEGLALLRMLTDLDVDILFTTRYAFSELELTELAGLAYQQESRARLLVGCISALSMRATELEPRPIPPAARRLDTLNLFPDVGVIPVLALRPLMPSMTKADIVDLLDAAAPAVKHVVSGWLYYSRPDQLGSVAEPLGVSATLLDFDIARNNSKEYRNEALMQFPVSSGCLSRTWHVELRSKRWPNLRSSARYRRTLTTAGKERKLPWPSWISLSI